MKNFVSITTMLLLPIFAWGQTNVTGAGATFPSAVYQIWAQKYESTFNKQVTYTPTGSGDGVKKIVAREVSLGGTDSPVSDADLVKHRLVQVPVLVGGIVPVINIKGVAPNEMRLTGQVLADIFRGDIKTWNDKRIQSLNPNLSLPNLAITRVVRNDRSGSTEVFTKYLSQMSTEFKNEIGVSSLPNWTKSGGAASAVDGNDGVAKGVRDNQGSVGYLSYDRVMKFGLSSVRMRSGDGATFVAASEDGFTAAVKASDMYRSGDETSSLLNTPGASAWPITLATFILLDAQPKTASSVATAIHFLYWTQISGDRMVRNTGFAPLPAAVQAKFASRLLKIQPQDGKPIVLAAL